LLVLDKKISKEKLILSELKIFPKSVVSAEAAVIAQAEWPRDYR